MNAFRWCIALVLALPIVVGCADSHINRASLRPRLSALCVTAQSPRESRILYQQSRKSCLSYNAIAASSVRVSLQGVGAPIIRDSAGVRIVNNKARSDAPIQFVLGSRATFEVGGLEASDVNEFNHTAGYLNGTRLSDGRFAVIDVNRIHYFDSRGRRVKIVGRDGSGPGEFRYLTAVCRNAGDTLVVVDSRNARFVVVDPSGNVERTFPIGNAQNLNSGFCLPDGTIVVLNPITGGMSNLRRGQLTRRRLDGTIVNVVSEVTIQPRSLMTLVGSEVATFGQKVFFGDGASGEVLVFAKAGTLTSIVRTDDKQRPVTAAEIEKRIRLANPSGPQATSVVARMRSEAPKNWPTFRSFKVDSDGKLWIQDYDFTYGQDHWTAFDSTGRMIGRLKISLPAERNLTFHVLSFGHDEVLIRRMDADGAGYLSIFPVLRLSSPSQSRPK